MGAINYGSNKIINLGYTDFRSSDDTELDEFLKQEQFDDICNLLDDYTYYTLELKHGYYDGFYLNIERNYYVLDSYKDRQTMLQEWATIQALLIDIVNNYDVACYSAGWCMGYLSYKDTLQKIKQVGKFERQTIKSYKLESNFASWGEKVAYCNSCTL